MGKFYGAKIKNEEINQKTGEEWKLEDVPALWRKLTAGWLAENT